VNRYLQAPASGLRAALRPFRRFAQAFRSTRRTVAAVPDLVDAILVLPAVTRQLEVVAFQTASLADLHEALLQVQRNTAVLPRMDDRLAGVHEALARVDANTQAVERLAEVALPLHGAALRLGRFADRLPQRRVVAPPNASGR
jgi:hypothetical protein